MPAIFRCCCAVLLASLLVRAQDQPNPKTLLPAMTLDAIAAEVSGANAANNVLEMCPYERVRTAAEYNGTYREAEYATRMAKQYGYTDPHIERFPMAQKQWAGEMAELWITVPPQPNLPPGMAVPTKILLTRYSDLPATLATGSKSGDVTAEIVYVGRGDNDSDYAGKDVKGKIVFASGPVGAVHNMAVRKYGAEGVVTYANGTGKPIDRPDQIAWSGIGGGGGGQGQQNQGRTTWGFILSHRMGMELLSYLESHRGPVTGHAIVKTTEYDAPMEVVVATIPGQTAQEVVFVAHLFEGIAKQGANDNCSGPATQLEAGRAWIKLIHDGVLPQPKRTVRFIWVPEISGSRAYINAHPDHPQHVLAAVDMDMVGADQTKNHNSLHLNLTPASLPSFLNEICQQFIEYVGDTNREKLHNRRVTYGFLNPIVDPKGSHDPFWYHVEKFYGSSDHQVYLDATPRVPSIQFGNWPDAVYHTSEDSPMFQDPTQMKRAAFISVAVGSALANADAKDAVAVAGMTVGHAQQRIGEEMVRASQSIAGSKDAAELQTNYKEAVNMIRQGYTRESGAIKSAAALASDKSADGTIAALDKNFSDGLDRHLAQLKLEYQAMAGAMHTPATEPTLSDAEKAASLLYPRPKPGTPRQPQGFGGGGGGGRNQAPPPLVGYYIMEARNFADGDHSLLDIRNALSAEFVPIPVENVERYFRELEQQGGWEIVRKEPPPAAKKSGTRKK